MLGQNRQERTGASLGKLTRGSAGGQHAFTLVEVVVACAIAAIILTALFAGISSIFNMLETARENLRATQIMVSRMEGLRLCNWDTQLFNPSIVPPTFTDYFYPVGFYSRTNDYGTIYSGTMTITTNFTLSPAASYNNHLALVTVTVSWNDNFHGATTIHRRSMSTYVAQYGVQNYIFNNRY